MPTPTAALKPADFPELQPLAELDALAAAPGAFSFAAADRAAAERWRTGFRAAFASALGFVGDPPVDPEPRLLEEADRGAYLRRKYLIRTSPHSLVPLYLLLPKGRRAPAPLVLAHAGHGYGAKDVVGLWEDGSERTSGEGIHADFAVELARRGFVVAAPEIACFGERRNDYSGLDRTLGSPEPTSCHHAAAYALMLGASVAGLRIRDSLRVVDFAAALPEVDASRIGSMGLSGGGMLTLYHAVLDERVRAFVVSGYLSSFRASLLAMHHCSCNYVPGLLALGDMADIAGLAAPRPFLAESGSRDHLFPAAAARAAVARVRGIYAACGADPANVEQDEFEGRHRISGRRAYAFLEEKLAAAGTPFVG